MDTPTSDPVWTAHEAIRRAGPMLHRRPVLVTSDFDGTVSVPQMDPWAAMIVPQAQRALRSLASMDGVRVALLSGRTAADLSRRVRVGGVDYLGNQGLERGRLGRRQRPGSLEVVPHPASAQAWAMARLLAREVPRSVSDPWLVVESKGPAVTFHYRGAPDVAAAGVRVARTVDVLDPAGDLVRFPGRRSLELRPPGAPAKGEAFRTLLNEVRPAIAFMLGDDRTDAAAFRVLRAARDAGEIEGMAIAVGGGPMSLEETGPHADIVLGSPEDAARFLALLTRALGPSRSGGRSSARRGQSS
jgi:trehalose 6-phosphate phosphatase